MCADTALTCEACCAHSAGCAAMPDLVVNCLVSVGMTWKGYVAVGRICVVSVQDTGTD